MDKHQKTISIDIYPKTVVTAKRIWLDDLSEDYTLIPIEHSATTFFTESINDHLVIPKLYDGLKQLTGKSERCPLEQDGSFSFAFLLNVKKSNYKSKYLLVIYHYQTYIQFALFYISSIYFPLEQIMMIRPIGDFFSNLEICYVCHYICDLALNSLKDTKQLSTSFFKCSNASMIIFGNYRGEYFFQQFSFQNEFKQFKKRVKRLCYH